MKKILTLLCLVTLLFSSFSVFGIPIKKVSTTADDIEIIVDILAIRALDKIDRLSDPDFFVKIIFDDEEYVSDTWKDAPSLYDCCSFTKNISEDVEKMNVTFQLWDKNLITKRLCDISGDRNQDNIGFDTTVVYDIKTGRWSGDDYIGDPSGYGRLNGCDDGSIYENELDCELWFDIKQEDSDGDGIPYWIETNVYGTDPLVDDTGSDIDEDGIPIEWEHRFGFNPLIWDDHEKYDPDQDSLNNLEEYLTWSWDSDPYRRDVFLEMDHMEPGPEDKQNDVPVESYELLKNPFHRRNIVFHVDYEVYGGDLIPFDNDTKHEEAIDIYETYFIKNESENWRRSVFHYAVWVYYCKPMGYAFRGDMTPSMGYLRGTNSFIVCTALIDKIDDSIFIKTSRPSIYASDIMHEMGHNFGLRWGNPFGVDCQFGKNPWQPNFWIFGRYKSIMNYRYTYSILDYSDGSNGFFDHDDWETIELSYFEKPSTNYYP